jgi:protein SCO1/2
VVGDAAIGGPFVLTRADGARVRFEDVVTRPTLLYFGYSFCPDFCPMDLARNARAADLLAERGIEVGQIFVSIDPARDTPEVVGDFATAIHPDIIGLTGSAEDVAAAAGAYRVYFRKADEDPEYYLMDHSTFSYLVAPEHPFLDFFRSGASAEEVAEQTACFAERLSLG